MSNPQRRVDWVDRDGPEFVDVPYWRVAGSYATAGFVVGFVACLLLMAFTARAGGPEEAQLPDCSQLFGEDYEDCVAWVAGMLMEQQVQQQQRPFPPEQLASANQPTIVVDKESSISEWAALVTGIAALIAALGGLEYRRRHRHETQGGQP